MRLKHKARCIVSLLITTFFTASTSLAADQDAWKFDFAPLYLWAVNVDGDSTVRGVSNPLQLDFGDIFDNLDGAFISHFEAVHNDKWGVIVDVNYLNIGNTFSAPVSAIDLTMKETIATFDGFYRITQDAHKIDLVAGLRYNELKLEYNFLDRIFASSMTENWWDPVIGVRYRYPFNDQWRLQLRGDIGGFGLGSDFTWQTVAMLDYQPWKNVSLTAGYRALHIDYENGDGRDKFVYDVTIHGPVIGFNIRW